MNRIILRALAGLCVLGAALVHAQNPDRGLRVQNAKDSVAGKDVRLALVIGNGAYKTSPLKNPPKDAQAVSRALRSCGFQVQTLVDATLPQMETALRQFGQRLKAGGVGLFYYAGHGMQVKGTNYLIPVGAEIIEEDEIRFKALDANEVLAKVESAGNGLNLIILDACRNDPFGRSWRRGGTGGLAQMDAPTGTYIAFATAPGKTASDGDGENGLYTRQFLEALKVPGLNVEQVFKRVRVGVKHSSHDQQVPWDSSSLTGEFYFKTAGGAEPSSPVGTPTTELALGFAVDVASPWKLLTKDGLETLPEYEARIKALPPLLLGQAILQRGNYDIERQRLPVALELEDWAKPYVRVKKVVLELNRDKAKGLCDAGDAQRLEGRFTVHAGKAVCTGLEVVSPYGRYLPFGYDHFPVILTPEILPAKPIDPGRLVIGGQRASGVIVVNVLIGEGGKVLKAHVLQGLPGEGPGVENAHKACEDVARSLAFSPARTRQDRIALKVWQGIGFYVSKGGNPPGVNDGSGETSGPSASVQEALFEEENVDEGALVALTENVVPARPVNLSRINPRVKKASGVVVVNVLVSETGDVLDVSLLQGLAGDGEWARLANMDCVESAKRLVFEPARANRGQTKVKVWQPVGFYLE
jgi:hypothetical protein